MECSQGWQEEPSSVGGGGVPGSPPKDWSPWEKKSPIHRSLNREIARNEQGSEEEQRTTTWQTQEVLKP